MSKKTTIWTVTVTYRWTDIAFQFSDAEEAAIFAQKIVENFAPHYSDFYAGSIPAVHARIELVTPQENDEKKAAYNKALFPELEEHEMEVK